MDQETQNVAPQALTSDLQWIPVEEISYLIHSVRPRSSHSANTFDKSNSQTESLVHGDQPRLGKFDSVWQFLGIPADGNPPDIKVLNDSEAALLSRKGFNDQDTPSKGVKWRDEIQTGDKLEDYTTRKYLMTLTKSQKRLARKDRQKLKGRRFSSEGDSSESESAKGKSNKFRKIASQQLGSSLPAVFDASSEDEKPTPKLELSPETRRSVISEILGHDLTPTKKEAPKPPPGLAPKNLGLEVYSTGRIQILPLLEPKERVEQLETKLFTNFPQDRTTLAKLKMPTFLSNVGVYIFVDFSNILIGFYECLKRARGIASDEPHVRRTPFSFKSFSQIVERGRTCSRRVVVGSLPETTAVTEAKELGYDVDLLERVHKMRDISSRQNSQSGRSSGMSSGSETTARFKMKLVEQAVDELLQMKMLESLLDAASPTTAVLATGDGAVAEYSEGFFKVVERFLERDWTVELVSFKRQTNWCYRDPAFKRKWGGKFKLTALDEYCECLFGDQA